MTQWDLPLQTQGSHKAELFMGRLPIQCTAGAAKTAVNRTKREHRGDHLYDQDPPGHLILIGREHCQYKDGWICRCYKKAIGNTIAGKDRMMPIL